MSEEKGTKQSAKSLIKERKRRTLIRYSKEEKMRTVLLEGLRGEESVSALSRKYAIHESVYYKLCKTIVQVTPTEFIFVIRLHRFLKKSA